MYGSGNKPESRRADIARHRNINRRLWSGRGQFYGLIIASNFYTQRADHALRMIPGSRRLYKRGLPLGEKAGNQYRRLDLGAGNRQLVCYPLQSVTFYRQWRERIVFSAPYIRTHMTQRVNQAIHGTRAQGIVPCDNREERLSRQQPAK